MPKKKLTKVYNGFTKSYKLRYVVHGYRKNDPAGDKTICGRDLYKKSTESFDETAGGSCKKCIKGLEIERRIHPGWEG